MLNSKRTLGALALMGSSMLAAVPAANAALILALDDTSTAGIDAIVVDNTDGGVGTSTFKGLSTVADSNTTDGVVNFSGAVGSFIVNVTTGISKPVLKDKIDISSVNVSGGAGTLKIWLADTGFSFGAGTSLISNIGGTTNGTITWDAFAGSSEGSKDYSVGGPHSATVGPFSASHSAIMGAATSSLLSEITITHTLAGQITSFDHEVTVSEPATLGLIGLGLAGLGVARRKKAKS